MIALGHNNFNANNFLNNGQKRGKVLKTFQKREKNFIFNRK